MQSSARLYFCCRCQAQVIICSRCDRGQRYCTGGCAADARTASLQRAAKKYRSTRAGRTNNAARQKRYRERQKQKVPKVPKVTHQGSPPDRPHDVLKTPFDWPGSPQQQDQNGTDLFCHHCGAVCDPYLRQDFLHQSRLSGVFRQSSTAQERPWQ